MFNTQRLLKNNQLCRSLTGLNPSEIETLVPVFADCLIQHRYTLKPREKRLRRLGGGQKGDLPTTLDKLVFVLIYLKVYPTYDVLAFFTGRQKSKCHRSIQLFLPVLESSLGRHLALPERKITSVDEFLERFPGVKDIIIDGTERPTQKPKDPGRRKKLYSGKKKMTTRKTILGVGEDTQILLMTPTKSGRRHDKRLADKFSVVEYLPDEVTAWTDTGFQGIRAIHPNTCMPKKATKKHPLTEEEKTENRLISSFRIKAEHAIAGMKRMNAAAAIYRGKLANQDHTFSLLAAGLWNFHLQNKLQTQTT